MTNLEALIRENDPALGEDLPDGSSAIARWTYPHVVASPSQWARALPSQRRRWIVAVVAGAVVAASVLIGVVPSTGPPAASASQLLHSMARLAAMQSSATPGPGLYLYSETASEYQVTLYVPELNSDQFVATASAQYSETEDTWANASGSGSGQETRSALQFSSAADEATWNESPAAQDFSLGYRQSESQPDLGLFAPNVSSLPTNTSALAAALAQGGGATNPDLIPDGPAAVFQRAARLLIGPDVGLSSALVSALYEVMAEQPGVQLLGTTTDHQGRPGTGVAISTSQGVSEVIVDTQDASPLEASFIPPTAQRSAPTAGGSVQLCPTNGGTCIGNINAQEQILVDPLWTDSVQSSIVSRVGVT